MYRNSFFDAVLLDGRQRVAAAASETPGSWHRLRNGFGAFAKLIELEHTQRTFQMMVPRSATARQGAQPCQVNVEDNSSGPHVMNAAHVACAVAANSLATTTSVGNGISAPRARA